MSDADDNLNSLLQRALSGDEEALGRLLDEFRPWLRLLARRALDARLAGRIDDSDVVQQTYLSAIRRFEEFKGSSTEELAAWLRAIHERNLIDETRKHIGAEKRAVGREETQDQVASAITESSPSQRLMQGESAVQLARVLTTLPRDQEAAVRLRHLEGWSLNQIAEHMDRTDRSVANLLHRGLANLRDKLTIENGKNSNAGLGEHGSVNG